MRKPPVIVAALSSGWKVSEFCLSVPVRCRGALLSPLFPVPSSPPVDQEDPSSNGVVNRGCLPTGQSRHLPLTPSVASLEGATTPQWGT